MKILVVPTSHEQLGGSGQKNRILARGAYRALLCVQGRIGFAGCTASGHNELRDFGAFNRTRREVDLVLSRRDCRR